MDFSNMRLSIFNGQYTANLLILIDGKRTIRELFDAVRAALPTGIEKPDDSALMKDLVSLYRCFNHYDMMFLWHRSVPSYRSVPEATELRGRLLQAG